MKTIQVSRFGGPEVLVLLDGPAIAPEAGQISIAVEAVGVGFVDVMARQGTYPLFPEPGFVPGVEVAGTVDEVGPDVDANWRGRRVFAVCGVGGYAERVVIDLVKVVPLPDKLSAGQAVGTGVNALVASFALERTGADAGEHVLVRGASGGIGVMATQLAARKGCVVMAVTSSASRADRLRALGATRTILRGTGEDTVAGAYDVVVDTVGGSDMGRFLTMLKPNGRYVLCGGAGGPPPADLLARLFAEFHKSPSLMCFSLNSIDDDHRRPVADELFRLTAEGSIEAVIDEGLRLDQAAEAHRRMAAGDLFGKIVLRP
ncbi:MAG: zinc-binding dehydrogenase [Azospirillaceae bacterium]|nr:zinc-binding dehydrogenase [Azospirillaceae bacterium]